jgi:DUF4097 and DUF4098 domain-containing protein YvlB
MHRFLNPIVLVAGVWLGAAAYVTAQSDFDWTGQLAPGQSVEIQGVNGSIRASAARDGNIVVTAVKTAGRHNNASDVRIETVSHSGGVTVCAIYPAPAGQPANECKPGGRGRNSSRDNDTSVDFTVQLPSGIGLIAQTVNGSVDGQGLQGDVAGTTVNGSLNLSTTGSARATTVNGSINATMGRAVWSNGGKFTTVNGDVTLRLPAAVNADVHLSTVSGRIRSDFPLTMNDIGPKRADGVIGTGGQKLDVTTVNGGISLLKR